MKNRIERIERIRSAKQASENDNVNIRTKSINWRGPLINLRVIRIDSELLMYRIENSRTIRQHLKYLREHPELPRSLFADPESSLAQNAQEEILIEMVRATGKEFIDDLETRGQIDPAIITYDGYIINGNRRTAALRQIGEKFIDCVVLPEDAGSSDFFEIEQELQMAQEFKEEYHWVNELNNINLGIKVYGDSEEKIAKRLRCKPADIKAKLRMMDLVDRFLIWKNIPKAYDYAMLDDAEEAFIVLEKATHNTKYESDPLMMEQLQQAIFNLVEVRPKTGRLYNYVVDCVKNFEKVYETLREKEKVKEKQELVGTSEGVPTTAGGSIIDELVDEEVSVDNVFGDSDKADELSKKLIETIADVKAKNKEQKDTEIVYESVSNALRELQGLTVDDKTIKLESIINKLEQIIQVSGELLSNVKKFYKGG